MHLSVLAAKEVRHLSLGAELLDEVFPGFELGDFAVLHGSASSFVLFVLSVRCQLPVSKGGLGSSVVFVDGGNSFNPYLVAEIAVDNCLDSRSVLDKIYVSRAFTAYQFSSLVLEKLEPFLRKKRSKLVVVSDVTSFFFDKDIPRIEARDLFMKVCAKLSSIAARKSIVVASYLPRKSKRGIFLEAVLYGRSNILARFSRRRQILSFTLEDHPHVKQFTMDLPVSDYASLRDFMEV